MERSSYFRLEVYCNHLTWSDWDFNRQCYGWEIYVTRKEEEYFYRANHCCDRSLVYVNSRLQRIYRRYDVGLVRNWRHGGRPESTNRRIRSFKYAGALSGYNLRHWLTEYPFRSRQR